MNGDDRDLRDRFAALRREEEARVPAMARLSRTGHEGDRRRSPGELIAATLCLAIIIAAALWLRPAFLRPQRGPNPNQGVASVAVASITDWKPPTSFLLETPGRELLRTVPAIGVWHGQPIPLGPDAKQRQPRRQVLP